MSELVDFSFSLDQLISAQIYHQQQHQQQQQPQEQQEQQQQQHPLRLPVGTCAASFDTPLPLEDCWDASAYMDGDFLNMDTKVATCSLVPELNACVAAAMAASSSPTAGAGAGPGAGAGAAAAVVSAAAAAAAAASTPTSWGGLVMGGMVGGLADELVANVNGSDDEGSDDEGESESSFSSQQQQHQQRHLFNNTQQQQQEPSQFSQELLNMSVREMHQFVKRSNFTAEQVADLKAERRRMKNRTYARTARCKRKTRQGALETTVQQAQQERQQLLDEVTSLRADVSLFKRKLMKAEAQLRNAGITPAW